MAGWWRGVTLGWPAGEQVVDEPLRHHELPTVPADAVELALADHVADVLCETSSRSATSSTV
jgi:hypothetical protein